MVRVAEVLLPIAVAIYGADGQYPFIPITPKTGAVPASKWVCPSGTATYNYMQCSTVDASKLTCGSITNTQWGCSIVTRAQFATLSNMMCPKTGTVCLFRNRFGRAV